MVTITHIRKYLAYRHTITYKLTLLYKQMLSAWNFARFISAYAYAWQVFSHLASVKTSEKFIASAADTDRADPVVKTTIDGSQLP